MKLFSIKKSSSSKIHTFGLNDSLKLKSKFRASISYGSCESTAWFYVKGLFYIEILLSKPTARKLMFFKIKNQNIGSLDVRIVGIALGKIQGFSDISEALGN